MNLIPPEVLKILSNLETVMENTSDALNTIEITLITTNKLLEELIVKAENDGKLPQYINGG